MTKLGAKVLAGKIEAPDVLVGGIPCQAYSVAGMRKGLADPRGSGKGDSGSITASINHPPHLLPPRAAWSK